MQAFRPAAGGRLFMTIKLAIFDFDGVLCDSAAWFVKELNGLASRHGFRALSDDEVQRLRGRPTREVVRHLRVAPWRMPAIARDLRARMGADADRIGLFDGAGETLSALRAAGVQLAVVSSNSEDNIRRILGPHADAVARFDCGAGLFNKAGKFRRVMKALGATPADTVSIGDEVRDIEAARKAGVRAFAVSWGYAVRDALTAARPDAVCDDFDDLRRRLIG